MKLVFIHPPLPGNRHHKKIFPLGIAYIAAYLRENIPDTRIRVLDAMIEDLDHGDVRAQLSSLDADLVGISAFTVQAEFAYELADWIKERFPRVKVVLGGVHPSLMPEEAIEHADFVVIGEGEETMAELIEALQGQRPIEGINGLIFRQDGKMVRTETRPFIADLDSLPFPAWDLFDMPAYNTSMHVIGGQRLPVIGSRGCPYNCTYCCSPAIWKRKVRYRSPDKVLDEMQYARDNLGIPSIHFWDDNLFMNRSYIQDLIQGMIDRNFNMPWTGLTRASHLLKQADLIPLLKQTGCIGIEIGIESANPDTFDLIDKQESLDGLREACRIQREHGLYPMFTYMAFNPGETLTGYYLQARFIDELMSGLPWADFFHPHPYRLYVGQFCTPHVGSRLFEEAPGLGKLLASRWPHYHHHRINFLPNSLLDEKPVVDQTLINNQARYLCLNAYDKQVYEFNYFHRDWRRSKQMLGELRFLNFLDAFTSRCNGTAKLRDMALDAAKATGIEEVEGLSFAGMISLVLCQRGIMHAAGDEPYPPPAPLQFPLNTWRRRIKYALMNSLKGPLRRHLEAGNS